MVDPLSVAGLAVGVVSLGFRVAGGITDYIEALNCQSRDISSVRRQNDSLRKTLQVVETSLSRLQNNHQDAVAVVQECLDSCKKELEALESLVVNFTACDQSTTDRKNRIKTKGKRLLYPFSRTKLEQLEAKLSNADVAFQLALQTLGLSVSQLDNEKLAALEATSRDISTSFLVVQSEISAISTPLQGIQSTISGFENRFDNLENLFKQLLVVDGTPQKITSAALTSRLIRKPGVLKDICDAAEVRKRPRLSETLLTSNNDVKKIDSAVSTYTGGRFTCMCGHRRRLQRKDFGWGALTFSFETATEQHLPGCRATQVIIHTERSRKISLTYVGLRRLLNSAIRISFAIPSGAGGWSLSPNFSYYPTVDSKTAPAFRVLTLLNNSIFGAWGDVRFRENLIRSAASTILRLFRTKKASPQAVDHNNRSLVYYLTKYIVRSDLGRDWRGRSHAQSSPLLDLLECLLVNKVPVNDFDIYGQSPLSSMFSSLYYSNVTDPLPAVAAELILRANAKDNEACLSKPSLGETVTMLDRHEQETYATGTAVLLHFFAYSTRFAEAYGCGPLSLAILSNDLKQVEHLVKNYPATLAERDILGHTPLHLAADKPECLRHLAKVADAKLLNQVDDPGEFGKTALETAVYLSGQRCRARTNRLMCRRCKCAESAVILLKADCALPVWADLQGVFRLASKRCKLRYIHHIKDRRDRLRRLALDNLSTTEVKQLGLSSERVLDSHALHAIQLLQDRGVCVPDSLTVARNRPMTVYQAFCLPWDAELFYRASFHDTDLWCNADAAELGDAPNLRQNLPYLYWLSGHGALLCQPKSVKSSNSIFKANFTYRRIGEYLTSWRIPHWPPVNDEYIPELSLAARKTWIHELNVAALPANIVDACRCKCSPGGCTPLTSLLKGAAKHYDHFRYRPSILGDKSSSADEAVANIGPIDCSVVEYTDSPEFSVSEDTEFPENDIIEVKGLPSELITHFTLYLECSWEDLEVRHHNAALRFLTYTALGIPHSCCSPYYNKEYKAFFVKDLEEIEYEHAYELTLLEELLLEFERDLISILQDPDQGVADLIVFWKRTWATRMNGVLDSFEGSDLTHEERRGAEEIGVVWEKIGPKRPKVTGNPYRSATLDYWMYELEKIEPEC